jgi:hypothetical protein
MTGRLEFLSLILAMRNLCTHGHPKVPNAKRPSCLPHSLGALTPVLFNFRIVMPLHENVGQEQEHLGGELKAENNATARAAYQ